MRKLQGFVFSITLLAGVTGISNQTIPTEVINSVVKDLAPNFTNGAFDWKVGDTLNFELRIKPVPVAASTVLQVTAMEKDAITLLETISYKTLKVSIETVLDPNTGQIKSIKVNGRPSKVPTGSASTTKVVKEEEAHIKVPAGEFDCIHIVTETETKGQTSQSEMWVNPAAIPISGMLKSVSVAGYATIQMELLSFVRGK